MARYHMKQHHLSLTPESNVRDGVLMDENKVINRTYDARDNVSYIDTASKMMRYGNLINISLYDDLLVLNGVRHKILSMKTV